MSEEKLYEAIVIIRPDLDKTNRENAIETLKKHVQDCEGKVLNGKVWSEQRPFCYPIKFVKGAQKKMYNEGLYYLLEFNLLPGKIRTLEDTLKLDDNVVRTLILKKG